MVEHVTRERSRVFELLAADRARVVSLVAVRTRMVIQFLLSAERLITDGAGEIPRWLGDGRWVRMTQRRVSFELRFGRESSAADVARVRLLARMLSHVSLKPSLVRETFATELDEKGEGNRKMGNKTIYAQGCFCSRS